MMVRCKSRNNDLEAIVKEIILTTDLKTFSMTDCLIENTLCKELNLSKTLTIVEIGKYEYNTVDCGINDDGVNLLAALLPRLIYLRLGDSDTDSNGKKVVPLNPTNKISNTFTVKAFKSLICLHKLEELNMRFPKV